MKRLLLLASLWLGLIAPASAVTPSSQPGDAAYSILSTDTVVITTTAFTAARTWTLPFAAASCIGQTCQPFARELQVIDVAGTITGTNTLTIAPQSGDTINGNAANLILSAAGSRVVLIPTSANNWQAITSGDYRSAAVTSGSAVSLTTNTGANVTSISLSQGAWQCSGTIARTLAASTSVTKLQSSISDTTATSGTLGTTMSQFTTAANVMAADASHVTPIVRLALAATTTYYLVAQDTFTVSTNAAYGSINCYRMR